MKDYKRLTKRWLKDAYEMDCKSCKKLYPNKHKHQNFCETDGCYEVLKQRLGELEDKIEDGTLVEWKHKKECLEEINKLNTQLFEISQKIEQGRLIELPCKVGDTVYVVSNYYSGVWEIYECVVDSYTTYTKHTFMDIRGTKNDEAVNFGMSISQFNKTVFLPKAKAEAKLAELIGGE